MTAFGIDDAVIRELVAPLRRDMGDDDSVKEDFARMAWTVVVEPGDQIAGRIIAALGAGAALTAVIAGDVDPASSALETDGPGARARQAASDAYERWQPRLSARAVVRALEHAATLGLSVALPHDEGWPEGLRDLGPAEPVALWCRGERSRLASPDRGVAIVGARAATGYGEYVTTELAAGVAERGLAVVSGGAYGIDASAHRAALAADGTTIAFLAGGLDRYYPTGNSDLLDRVAGSGLVIAEVPPGVPPTRMRFLSRNRLLAAASAATVVVEAGVRSGSINTANHALSLGRAVGAVPGPITSPTSVGCHRLIREEGVACVTSVEELIELAGGAAADRFDVYEPVDPVATRVLDALGVHRGSSVDEIARSSGVSVAGVLSVLGSLEAGERVRRNDSGWVRIARRTESGREGPG